VVKSLVILDNPFLTFTHLPKLTFIGDAIFICANNADFVIPSGPPDAPAGGLVVTGSLKNTDNCFYQQGAVDCSSFVTCP
jgi:hypothetical protein